MNIYRVWGDGTELDTVHAENPKEAIQITKMRLPETSFDDVFWQTTLIPTGIRINFVENNCLLP